MSSVPAITRRRMARRRHWLGIYKTRKGCSICGYREHPDALFFLSPAKDQKKFVAILKVTSAKTFVDYVRQRQLVCYNCHAIWQAGLRKRKQGAD